MRVWASSDGIEIRLTKVEALEIAVAIDNEASRKDAEATRHGWSSTIGTRYKERAEALRAQAFKIESVARGDL